MKSLWAQARSMWQALWRSGRLDAEMHEEMRFHVEMEAERLMREHRLPWDESRRRAHVAFGGLEKYRAAGREMRGMQWIDAIAFDCRLGLRMLVKYRWLTLVGSSAIAVAIAIGATFFEIVTEAMHGALPLDQGERVVALQYLTDNPGNPERRILHDFFEWREGISSVQPLGAFRTVEHNLLADGVAPEPVVVAEITASGFLVARTPPVLGRYLIADDERAGAPPVVVIGQDVWNVRFGADPAIIGRTIALSGNPHIVVGVMPQGFKFPFGHQYWTVLRAAPARYGRLGGPTLHVFGRLAPGVTMAEAQAELTVVGQRTAAAHPEQYERLRLVVSPYTRTHTEVDEPIIAWTLWMAQLLVTLLVVVVGVNLAILVYARTVARLGELAVRSALGASRRRILMQLFIEALVLSAIGAVAGLLLAQATLWRLQELLEFSGGTLPYWLNLDLSASTAIYALILAMLAAVVVGVLPGLKATSARFQVQLRGLGGGSAAGLGPTWTFLVVAQVAVAVAALPLAVFIVWEALRNEVVAAGFPAEHYVTGEMAFNEDALAVTGAAVEENAFERRVRAAQLELMRRLELEAGVSGVTFSSRIPGELSAYNRIEFDETSTVIGELASDAHLRPTGILQVAPEMIDVYEAQVVAGRSFLAGDAGGMSVIVNRAFVEQFMGVRSALGVRFRYTPPVQPSSRSLRLPRVQESGRWYAVVGIVNDFPAFSVAPAGTGQPTVYHAASPGDIHPVTITARLSGSIPADFSRRFRALGAAVDPAMQLASVMPLADTYTSMRSFGRWLAWGLALVTTSVLLLSAAGIYALMSFMVARRSREIGIRAALGGHPRRILLNVFSRTFGQLSLGVAVGSAISAALLGVTEISEQQAASLVIVVGAIVIVIGALAALGPAARGLRIQPTDVLRGDS